MTAVLWQSGTNRLTLEGDLPPETLQGVYQVLNRIEATRRLRPVVQAMIDVGMMTAREAQLNAGLQQLADLMVARIQREATL